MPAASSSRSSSSADSASSLSTSGAPRSPYIRPTPARPLRRRKVSTLAADPALESLGAVYVGWQSGERDPAPLCCPRRVKQSLVRKYGADAVGYLAVAPQDPAPLRTAPQQLPAANSGAKGSHLDHSPFVDAGSASSTPSLQLSGTPAIVQLSALPPLPPLPVPSLSASPDLVSFDISPSSSASCTPPLYSSPSSAGGPLLLPPLPPTLSFGPLHLPSTPPEPPLSSKGSVSPPQPPQFPLPIASPAEFDPTEFLNASLALFQPGCASHPPSPTLVFPLLPPIAPPPPQQFAFIAEQFATTRTTMATAKLETVQEDEYDESLWSAGEDVLGSSAATDVMSEASWAW
ncbi:hypothetical protein JCM10908_004887 [Rhodotorula pacifica]|uniref:uncharacterized protein n=1 Tax=Rhodotorula pacifica TaxID=1495444 RepID=UPI003175ABBC